MKAAMDHPQYSRLEKTAYHEAGHAVLSHVLGLGTKELSIVPGEDALGYHHPESSPFTDDMRPDVALTPDLIDATEKRILVLLAGSIAEKRIVGRSSHAGAGSDSHNAVTLALYLCGGDPGKVPLCLGWLGFKAEIMLHATWYLVEPVATLLHDRRQLTGDEVSMSIDQAEQEWQSAREKLK